VSQRKILFLRGDHDSRSDFVIRGLHRVAGLGSH
jgi:hypothetical protein